MGAERFGDIARCAIGPAPVVGRDATAGSAPASGDKRDHQPTECSWTMSVVLPPLVGSYQQALKKSLAMTIGGSAFTGFSPCESISIGSAT